MRAITLILATVGLLVGGFVAYWVFQPAPATVAPAQMPAADQSGGADGGALTFDDNGMPLGAGRNVWVKSYSQEGELTSEFTANRYDPQQDGTVLVERPRAKFYLRNGQYLLLTGDSGVVTIEQAAKAGRTGALDRSQRMQPPSRGELHAVNIFLFDALDAATPALTVELNNAAFDNETFRIYTEQYRVGETLVPADQVPVRVYGEDFEFYGRGLTIRWNELQRRLDLLEVAHGQKLVVKHPRRLGERLGGEQPAAAAAAPLMLATTDVRLAAAALPVAAPATRPAAQAYRAHFADNVRVEQNGRALATGDALEIELSLERRRSAATQPAAPATQPAAAEPASRPASRPTAQAAIDQSPLGLDQPVTVLWTGPLRVTPVEADAPPAGTSVISMSGSPLQLRQEIGQITAGRLRYQTSDARAVVSGTALEPVMVRDGQGVEIRTQVLEYMQAQNLVVLRGVGTAVLPMEDGAHRAALNAAWDQACMLRLSERAGGGMAIEQAQLQGNVNVAHPRLDLRARTLALDFAPPAGAGSTRPSTIPATEPATRPAGLPSVQLSRALAHGDVRATFRDEQGGAQTISADELELTTATDAFGRIYPRGVRADGEVRAVMGDQTFSGGHVQVALTPTTRPATGADAAAGGAVRVESLLAQQNVRVQTREATVQADQAQLGTIDGQRRVTFMGQPAATLSTSDATLTGPIVTLEPDSGRAQVRGPGSLRALSRSAQGEQRPVEVAWETGATLDAAANEGVITGNVTVQTRDADGQRQAVAGRTLLLTLDDAPATRPSTRPAAAPTTRPDDLDVLRNKRIRTITFVDDVELRTEQFAEGRLLRGLNLQTDRLTYSVPDERLVIPGAGRMLYEDHRPTAPPGPTTAPVAGAAVSGDVSQVCGLTAVAWDRELIFDQANGTATLSGNVRVAHEPEGAPADRVQMRADTIQLALQAVAGATTATTRPTEPRLNVARIGADGSVYFKSRGLEFRAANVEVDPQRHVLIARGSEDQPAELLAADGASGGRFGELRLNTQTQQIEVTDVRGRVRQ